jgi:colicin import membrane protein
VNPFIKEHAAPLVGAAFLHLLVLAGAIAATLWTVSPHLTPPVAIEAYIAARPSPKPTPPAAPAPAVEPTPATPPPVDSREQVEVERAAEKRAEEIKLAETQQAAVKLQQQKDAEAKLAEAKLAEAKAQQAQAHRDAEAATAKRAQDAEEAKRRVAAAEAQRRADEVKRKADAAADAQRRADAAHRAAAEADIAKQLAQEEHRDGVEKSGMLQQYITEIQARIERAWNRPPTAKPGLSCTVYVTQVPGGAVTNVRLGTCNGDAAVQQSITLAVYNASPLPKPPDPSLFDRNLRLEFAPQ